MANGNLRNYLVTHPDLSWSTKYSFAIGISSSSSLIDLVEIAKGIGYLHGLKPPVIHRDLKSMNVLIDNDCHIRIADFGISKLRGIHSIQFNFILCCVFRCFLSL